MILTSKFPGQNYPPSTIVSFPAKEQGEVVTKTGQVQKLLKKHARVVVDTDNHSWKVPYEIMTKIDGEIKPEISLQEIEDYAYDKLDEFGLDDWSFGFDLAQVRGGVCKHSKQLITLSVSFCCVATKEEVLDTVLHEIAHAIAGYQAGHGELWKKVAKFIGCKGEVYHTVIHGKDRWKGVCPCGKSWTRMKLSERSRKHAVCPKCDEDITWTRITSST